MYIHSLLTIASFLITMQVSSFTPASQRELMHNLASKAFMPEHYVLPRPATCQLRWADCRGRAQEHLGVVRLGGHRQRAAGGARVVADHRRWAPALRGGVAVSNPPPPALRSCISGGGRIGVLTRPCPCAPPYFCPLRPPATATRKPSAPPPPPQQATLSLAMLVLEQAMIPQTVQFVLDYRNPAAGNHMSSLKKKSYGRKQSIDGF